MPNFSDIVDAYKKIPTSLFITLGVFLGLVIFSSDSLAEKIGIQDFRHNYKVYIGPTLYVILAILFSRFIGGVFEIIEVLMEISGRKNSLTTLTPSEKACLREFIDKQQPAISANINHPVICSLRSKNILYLGSNISHGLGSFTFCLHPWARASLTKNPHFLD